MPFLEGSPSLMKPATSSSISGKTEHERKTETGLVRKAVMKLEQRTNRPVDSVELEGSAPKAYSPVSSVEISPTDSGMVTPGNQLTIAPCPARLKPSFPPKNFGAVEAGTIYRSGFPESNNIEFLEQLNLRTVLTLVETEADQEFHVFTSLYDVNHVEIPIVANKEGEIRTTHVSLCEAVLVAMNPLNYPLHIHCNRGKHRTGCIVACLRKIQRWPIEEVLAEYDTYASPKARPEDIELIKQFDPASVYEYAKKHDLVEGWPCESRVDSATDIWELASALPPHFLTPSTCSEASVDEDLVMDRAVFDPTEITYALDTEPSKLVPDAGHISRSEVSIAEVDEDIDLG